MWILLRSWCDGRTALPLSYGSTECSGQDSNLRPVDEESITATSPARSRKVRRGHGNALGCGFEPRGAVYGSVHLPDNRAAPARDDKANPPGFEPGPARLELAVLPLHHGLERRGRPGSNGPLRVGSPMLFRLSYIRMKHARLESNQRPLPPQSSALSTEQERSKKSPRQELNPHLGRTKGACLPLTLRRRVGSGDGGTRTHIGLVASEVLFQLSDVPGIKCGRVESNHHSARRRGYSPLSSPGAQRPHEGATDRIRTGTARITTSDAAVTPRPPRWNERGRPDSNRRPIT
jgi:hypothetical protein